MALYYIALHGCDETSSVRMELTPDEVALLRRVSVATQAAQEFQCQPTLTIGPITETAND